MSRYRLLLSDESRFDILEAYDWYNRIDSDLALSFESKIEAGLKKIQNGPLLFQIRYKSIRIFHMDRFPYGIHYIIDNETIRVLAVFHTSFNPKSWFNRS